MFHQQSAAARDRAASTSLLSVTVLDVLSSTPAGGSRRAPRICSPLVAPRCDRGATSGLITYWPAADGWIDGECGRGADRAAQPAIPAPGGGDWSGPATVVNGSVKDVSGGSVRGLPIY